MKSSFLFLALFAFFAMNSQAATYLCQRENSFVGDFFQVEVSKDSSAFCSYKKNGRGFDLLESGGGEQIDRNNDGVLVDFYTPYRTVTMQLPLHEVYSFRTRMIFGGTSNFGPLIPAGNSTAVNLVCTKSDVFQRDCDSYHFAQPENTPANFQSLKTNLADIQLFTWTAIFPTFTLVSPDLKDHIVVARVMMSYKIYFQDNHVEFFDIISAVNFVKTNYLKKNWSLVDIYSNEEGKSYFKDVFSRKE